MYLLRKTVLLLLASLLVLPLMAQGGERIRVACVGNSVTYGYLLPHRETEAYPSRLQAMLGDAYEVRNFGHSGATLLNKGHRPYTQQQAYKDALAFKPDRVVIHLGLNDTDPRNWNNFRDDFIPDYMALIESFRRANPAAKVWICRMTPIFPAHPRFQSGTREWHEQIQGAIEEVALVSGASLIDLYTPLHARPDLFPDALHPNAEGAQIIARTVYQSLTGDFGGLQLPTLYGEGMVLQQQENIILQGIANAGEEVSVTFADIVRTATAAANGKWWVSLGNQPAGGPYRLTIKTANRRFAFKEVYVGEVWLCSGQSNMEFQLRQTATAKADVAAAKRYGNIHLYNMVPRWRTEQVAWSREALDSVNRLDYFATDGWQRCSPQTAARFSAVAYHFGRHLSDSLRVPIGLICNAVGGANAESWIDRATLEKELPNIFNSFPTNDFVMDWCRTRAGKNIAQAASTAQRHPFHPSYLYEAGIAPLHDFDIRGVLWYQGESNAHNVELHERLFPMLARSWGNAFPSIEYERPLPFLYVQLSSLDRPSWTQFRFSQFCMESEGEGRYMVVSSDLGDSLDVHPRVKAPIGERLALKALRYVYQRDIVADSPRLFEAKLLPDKQVRLTFECAEGLTVSRGFELAGEDFVFHPARIVRVDAEKQQVFLKMDGDALPYYVRYGWQPFTRGDLRNGRGLPTSTFKGKILTPIYSIAI